MKALCTGLVLVIGISAIFATMIGVFGLKEYFPIGLIVAIAWALLVFKATYPEKLN